MIRANTSQATGKPSPSPSSMDVHLPLARAIVANGIVRGATEPGGGTEHRAHSTRWTIVQLADGTHEAVTDFADGGVHVVEYSEDRIADVRRQLAQFGHYEAWPDAAVIEADLRIREKLAEQAFCIGEWGVAGESCYRAMSVFAHEGIICVLSRLERKHGAAGAAVIAKRGDVLSHVIRQAAKASGAVEDVPHIGPRVNGHDSTFAVDVTAVGEFTGASFSWTDAGRKFRAVFKGMELPNGRMLAWFKAEEGRF